MNLISKPCLIIYDCLETFNCDISDESFSAIIENVSIYEGYDLTVSFRIWIIGEILELIETEDRVFFSFFLRREKNDPVHFLLTHRVLFSKHY